MTTAIAENLKKLGVTTLSDALDRLGIAGQCLGVMPVDRSMCLAGPAFTVRMLPVGLTGNSVGDYIDGVEPGQVVAIDNDGRLDATVWGDILTLVAHRRAIGGTVIDGVCRDIEHSIELSYPVFARSNTMRTGKDRVTADAYNVTVQIGGVRIGPGDWLVGDADGLIAIPAIRLDEVATIAEEIASAEAQIREAVLRGERPGAARKRLLYHSLQTKITSWSVMPLG
jgi:4-hydroxy-4-methyl-2-oxoglutarate aldolase